MADTIIERNTRADTDSSSGWAVAVVILIAVVVIGGLYLYYHRGAPALPNTGAPSGTNVNVTLPGGSGGATSGGTTGGGTSGSGGVTY